ncbi:YqaA family protein [Paenibacillus sp. GYB003]|uniref:YqaA family protein n=1 Tax=Paenibacillus sp. GYB003 TaxID=2994392 RepID=UPI002F963DB5
MFQETMDVLQNFGVWGMVIHSFLDAVIFPIPAFFLQMSLGLLDPSSALWIATAGYVACLLGTPVGYWLGRSLGASVLHKLLKKSWVDSATQMFNRNGEAAIFIGSFTPIPFKVFTILSGCLGFSLWRLIGYAAIGRAVKFYAVGALFYFYGRAAEGMVHGYLTYILLGVACLLTAFLLIKRKWRSKKRPVPRQAAAEE